MQLRQILPVALLGALVAACGSGTTSATAPVMNVYLVDGPTTEYDHVYLDIRSVEIASDSGWITLGTPNRVIDLLSLTNGVAATLANGATLPAGHYGQMRLVLGPNNSVTLKDGTSPSLTVPSGQQSGVKLTVSFDVQAGTTYDVYIDFVADKSIFIHEAGASGKYILRPTVRAYDKLETGSISGTLTVAGSTTPLPGVEVTAQVVTAGVPAVVRSARTDANGHFVLDLLRRDGTYFVVSQPVTADATTGAPVASYEPQVSAGMLITATAPVKTWDAAFTVASAVGGVGGAITPVATTSQADSVDVRLALDASAVPYILRTAGASVVAGVESYAVASLPTVTAGRAYTLVGTRRTVDAAGVETSVQSTPVTATVLPGATAAAPIAFGP